MIPLLGKVHCSRPLRALNPWRKNKHGPRTWVGKLSFLAMKMLKKDPMWRGNKKMSRVVKRAPVRLYAALLPTSPLLSVRSELCR